MARKVKQVETLYKDRSLYSSEDMFSPPAERLPHVIRFELTEGCNYGKCTYCGGFDGVRFREKTLEEYKAHVDDVYARVHPELADRLTRIFVGGGNGLAVKTNKLIDALQYTRHKFAKSNGGYRPRRIAIYGRTDSIKNKKDRGLWDLYEKGLLDLVYWGVETGSTDLMKYVKKGVTQEDILKAAAEISNTGVSTSVMIMPGLGGARFYEEHVNETALVLEYIKPKFLTFMGINASPNSEYTRRMAEEVSKGKNKPLKSDEVAMQMIEIIEKMQAFRTKVGCFSPEIDGVGCNPLTFKGFQIYFNNCKKDLTRRLKVEFTTQWDARFYSRERGHEHLAHLKPLLEVRVA
ncbi:MAG: radical SAM protein [archaeon]